MAHIADMVGKAKPMAGAEPPRLPGARGHAVKRKTAAEGIAMFDNLRAALKNVAGMIETHVTFASSRGTRGARASMRSPAHK